MSKKLHAKDLRRDQVAEVVTHAASDALHVAQEHRRPLLIAAIVTGVLVVGGTLVAWRVDASRTAAAGAYATAIESWEKASATGDTTGEKPTWESVAEQMKGVADAHGSSAPGKLARLKQGLALARAGKASEAAAAIDAFVTANPSHWAAPEALAALAAAREDAGDAAGAEAALVQLRDGHWRNWPNGAAQMLLGQLYERQGRAAEARALYETLTKDEKLKDTAFGSQAKARLDEMGAPAAS